VSTARRVVRSRSTGSPESHPEINVGVCRTLRSPAGDFPEGERSSPLQLHLKGFKREGYLKQPLEAHHELDN
jgi:hypothetical protein